MKNSVKNTQNRMLPERNQNEDKKRERTFDKKKYRLQKYSNKYQINQWKENKKKAALRKFHKDLQKDQQNSAQTSLDSSNKLNNIDNASESKKKGYAFHKAKQEYWCKKEEKRKKMEQAVHIKTEREEALKKYKEKKMRTFKALSKRTKKGQPVMKDRIEMLLERIQQNLT